MGTGGDKDTTLGALWKDNDYLILYFSAHWCPPCRGFTPKFAEWYKKNYSKKRDGDKKFDVVFMSSDRNEDAFKDYFKDMPWKALDFANRDLKGKFSDACGVQGIPTVAVIDKNYKIITTNGRSGVTKDTDCENFPWLPEPILDFNEDPEDINKYPSIILFLAGDSKEDVATKKAALKKIALERTAECKKEDEECDMRFFYVEKTDQGPATQLIKILNLGDTKDLKTLVCDLGEETKALFKSADDCKEEGLRKIVKSIADETIKTVGMKE